MLENKTGLFTTSLRVNKPLSKKYIPGLFVDDLGDVLEETLCSSTKWYKIGLRLRVPVPKLDGIRSQFSDQEECLCEMLKEWLKGAAGTKPTWEVLIEALKSQTVREPRLAHQLEAKHCQSERKSRGRQLCSVVCLSCTLPPPHSQ